MHNCLFDIVLNIFTQQIELITLSNQLNCSVNKTLLMIGDINADGWWQLWIFRSLINRTGLLGIFMDSVARCLALNWNDAGVLTSQREGAFISRELLWRLDTLGLLHFHTWLRRIGNGTVLAAGPGGGHSRFGWGWDTSVCVCVYY